MKKKIIEKNTVDCASITVICLSVFAVFFAIWTFTGKWPWIEQPYNSYVLQAQSWLEGRLSLVENYSHLEIAVFEGKYYISFPPFPSYVMLPFVVFGITNCDGGLALFSAILGAVYAFKICEHFGIKKERAILFTLLLTIGSNWLFTAQSAWVWFIAQNFAFTLSLMAIYYALKKRAAFSLAFWACAVGSRPLQMSYLPILLYLLYDKDMSFAKNIKANWKSVIPMAIIAISYMMLNFARFGNPFEFGHNYLPEFTEAEHGQFSIVYIAENMKSLLRLPEISFKDKWNYQAFNGTNIFIVSPVFVSYIVYSVYAFIKNKADKKLIFGIFAMVVIQLVCITAHKTMGGSQFGNRYTNDVLPLAFLSLAVSLPDENKFDKFNAVLLIFGLIVNTVGAAMYYGNV